MLSKLGEGSFGAVWLAESASKKLYALKKIKITPQDKENAKKEAQMYVKFDHLNILKADSFFFYNQEKIMVIVLEYCPDGNLSKLIGKLNELEGKKIIEQIT
jgi:serine/threonine protein kinase